MNSAQTIGIIAITIIAVAMYIYWLLRSRVVMAQPDQWLLRLRDGKLLDAGVGITRVRKPGDTIVRFTSTLQRVRFTAEVISADRVNLVIEGFVLWSISCAGEAPFKAYRKLGLTRHLAQDAAMRTHKHLLTTPQHRAFRKLVSAEVQRCAAKKSLDDLLLAQDNLVGDILNRLTPLMERLGLEVVQVEVVHTRALDAGIMEDLSCGQVEVVREEATRLRLESAERTKRRQIESATRLALEEANAERDREVAQATAALELEQRQADLLEAQRVVEHKRLENERDRRLLTLALEEQVTLKQEEASAQLELIKEANAAKLSTARQARERLDADAAHETLRATAKAQRDASMLVGQAEDSKSAEVRRHEIQRLQVEAISAALGSLPIKDARWVSVGDNPLTSLAAMLTTGVQGLLPDAEAPRD